MQDIENIVTTSLPKPLKSDLFLGCYRCTHHCQTVFKISEQQEIATSLTEPHADNLSAWQAFYCHT